MGVLHAQGGLSDRAHVSPRACLHGVYAVESLLAEEIAFRWHRWLISTPARQASANARSQSASNFSGNELRTRRCLAGLSGPLADGQAVQVSRRHGRGVG